MFSVNQWFFGPYQLSIYAWATIFYGKSVTHALIDDWARFNTGFSKSLNSLRTDSLDNEWIIPTMVNYALVFNSTSISRSQSQSVEQTIWIRRHSTRTIVPGKNEFMIIIHVIVGVMVDSSKGSIDWFNEPGRDLIESRATRRWGALISTVPIANYRNRFFYYILYSGFLKSFQYS